MSRERSFEPLAVANREIRRVPRGWQHPVGADGKPVPMFAEDMPEPGEGAEIMAYETTTEGTPISPAFPDTPDGRLALVNHCAEHATTFGRHRAGAEAWAAILFGNGATVRMDGTVEAS
jgi:hypothetical protein